MRFPVHMPLTDTHAEQVHAQLIERSARDKIPVHLSAQRDALPRNANGNLIKGDIRKHILKMMMGADR
jgi:hypothetical protein